MESDETWRKDGYKNSQTVPRQRSVSSLQRKVKRQADKPVLQVQEVLSPERKREFHDRCVGLVEDAQALMSHAKQEGLYLQALKLGTLVHGPKSFWRGYLHGLVGDALWMHSAEEQQAGHNVESTQLINRALDHFAAFEVIFRGRVKEVFLPVTDIYDWQPATEEFPLWVLYVSLLKSFAAALGFKLVGFLPLLNRSSVAADNTEHVEKSDEFKLVRRHTPTLVSKLVLRMVVRGKALEEKLSGGAQRVVNMAAAQARDFLENPLENSSSTEDKEASALLSDVTQLVGVRRSCSWGECDKVEAFPGDFSRCGRCRVARYCCKEHQAADWRWQHRKTCTVEQVEEHI